MWNLLMKLLTLNFSCEPVTQVWSSTKLGNDQNQRKARPNCGLYG